MSQNPFGTNVFVENYGQFNNWIPQQNTEILFGVNNGDKIFFTHRTLIFKISKLEKKTDADENIGPVKALNEEEYKEAEKKKYIRSNYHVQLEWVGSNNDVTVKGIDKVSHYFTFAEKGYEQIHADGYKHLLYKNLYKGIDVEYSVPSTDSNGIKYKIIIHPGGNYQNIRMRYKGDVQGISINNEGNVIIETASDLMIDHAPNAYYLENRKSVAVKFAKDENGIYFDFEEPLEKNKTVIIDPWIVVPTTLTNNNRAYDVDFDDYGNIYIFGGYFPYKLAKYDGSGNLLWTYTIPATFAASWQEYSEFALIRQSGSVFIGEGFGNPDILKVNSSGVQVFNTTVNSNNNEIWTMFYNPCNGKLFGFGGGTTGSLDNLYLFSDTNLTSLTMINFNGATGFCCNDVAEAIIDISGDFYGLSCSLSGVNQTNYIYRSLQSNGYFPPTGFSVFSGYTFDEVCAPGIFAGSVCYSGNGSNRANALALNLNYLFSYDGQTLKAWDKTNGSQLGSILVNAAYIGGMNRTHEGITADECDNVYVGGNQAVHMYSFNGSTFTPQGNITTNIPGEVYDLMVDEGRTLLYACGNGFLSAVTSLQCNGLTATDTVISNCGVGSATVTVTGGTPPYTYLWSNGATTSTVSNLSPGTYTFTILDGSCIKKSIVDSITVTSGGLALNPSVTNATCFGSNNGSATITAGGGTAPYTYLWSTSPPQITQTATGLTAGSYSVVVADASGCSNTFTVTITQPAALTATATVVNNVSCNGGSNGSATSSPTGGTTPYTYWWTPSGQTAQTVTGLLAGTYSAVVTDSNGCTTATPVTITQPAPILLSQSTVMASCGLSDGSATVTPSGGTSPYTYLWLTSPVQNTQTINNVPTGTYTVIVTDANGCTNQLIMTVPSAGPPYASFTYDPDTTINLLDATVFFFDLSVNANQWQWNFGDPNNPAGSTQQNPIHIYSDTGTYCITLIITDPGGACKDTTVRCLRVEAPFTFYIPNAFTPNGDIFNELFMGYGTFIKEFKMWLFDRWGNLIWSCETYGEPQLSTNCKWNGKVQGGSDLVQEDVYVWKVFIVDVNDKKHDYIGHVTVVR